MAIPAHSGKVAACFSILIGISSCPTFVSAQELLEVPPAAPAAEILPPRGPVITPPEQPSALRTQSQSGQFIIWGEDPLRRTTFARQCEQIRKDFASVLKLSGKHHFPIHLRIHEKRDQPKKAVRRAVPSIKPIEHGGFLFRLELLVDDEFDPAEFERELIRLLILEQMYAPHKEAKFDRIPTWLLSGVIELIHYQREGRPSEIFKTLVNAHHVLSIHELMAMDPEKTIDDFTKQVHRACSAALVRSLLDQGNGELRMRAFLEDLAIDDGDISEMLKRHFSSLQKDEASLAKWWALQIATMSERSGLEQLTLAETEKRLALALTVHLTIVEAAAAPAEVLPDEKNEPSLFDRLRRRNQKDENAEPEEPIEDSLPFQQGSIHDFERFIGHPQAATALTFNHEQLLILREQAFPLYQNLITGYDLVIGRLLEGEISGVTAELTRLDAQRAEIQEMMRNVADHLNWFEATQIKTPSNTFEAYEKALDRIKALDAERRTDPISRYLDAIEDEFKP